MTADDPCHQDFYSPRELLFFDGSNLTNATEAYLPPVLTCLLSTSDATEQLKQVISAALGLSFSAGDQLTDALLGAMRAALGAPTTMADDEVRRLVALPHACMQALATAPSACMRSDCAPAHACAHHGVSPFPTGARALDLARRARVQLEDDARAHDQDDAR